MRCTVVLLIAAACGQPATQQDAGNPSPDVYMPPCPMAPSPLCSVTCGNGVIDTCWYPDTSHDDCFRYYMRTEVCDGTINSLTCEQKGYYGGMASCQQCQFSAQDCLACAASPELLDCRPLTMSGGFARAETAQGTRLLQISGSTVTVFDANTLPITQLAQGSSFASYRRVIGVPTGWLAVQSTVSSVSVSPIDTSAAAGAVQSVWQGSTNDGELMDISIAYGAGNRALIAWTQWHLQTKTSRIWIAVVGADASVIVPATELLGFVPVTAPEGVSVASDGSSFFVGATRDDQLRRIASNGSPISSTTGYPISATKSLKAITWDATTGWFVTGDATQLYAQRFDANAAPVGAVIAVPISSNQFPDLVAHGDALAITYSTVTSQLQRFWLAQVDTAGSVSAPIELGVGNGYSSVLTVGANVAVSWTAGKQHLAFVAP